MMENMNRQATPSLLDCDEEGFLRDSTTWNHSVARQLASMHGIDQLDERQWALITTLRQYYLSCNHLLQMRRICHIHEMENNCVSLMFDNHGIEAWRIAGLPNPGEEAKSYM